ncbi:MAG: anti-sigma factor family protein [Candidatus Aminicenantia bacterium]
MNCKEIPQFLDDYLLNKIEFGKRNLFEEHIKECPECKKEVEIEYKIKNAFKNIAKCEVSENFKQKVLSQIPGNLVSSFQKQKLSIFKGLFSLLERDTLFWIIFGFLIPFIMVSISLAIFKLSEQIEKALSQIEISMPILSPEQILIINLIMACSALSYGFWHAYRFIKS